MLEVKAFGAQAAPKLTVKEIMKDVFVLENEALRVQVEGGVITSIYDSRVGREVVAKGGKVNQFVLFDDKPLYWQAWDVELYHLESRKVLPNSNTRIVENSAHRVSVQTETRISDKSWVKTTISLSSVEEEDAPRIEFDAEVEWQESMKFLKVEFPVDVRNTEASYETAFGIVKRPTHYNTTWDMAKFEVCCHKFADLSENGYGVSILNESKYGFATVGNLMRLSLLRAPKAPDAHADMGRHQIRWALMPHKGSLGPETVSASYHFNIPMKVMRALSEPPFPVFYYIAVHGDEDISPVILDTIKRGEDDEDVSRGELPTRKGRSVIIRVYESLGGTSKAIIESMYDLKRVWKTNILEDNLEELQISGGRVHITLRPFEVATYRLEL